MSRVKPQKHVIIQHTIYRQTDSRTTYLVGLSQRFTKFEYVRFPSLKIAQSVTGCHFLLEHPSCFVSKEIQRQVEELMEKDYTKKKKKKKKSLSPCSVPVLLVPTKDGT